MSLIYNGEEVELVVIIRGGKDAWVNVYAVPKQWAEDNNIKPQYDWQETTDVPDDVLSQIIAFPELEDVTSRIWEC